jgi:hypothetical protein
VNAVREAREEVGRRLNCDITWPIRAARWVRGGVEAMGRPVEGILRGWGSETRPRTENSPLALHVPAHASQLIRPRSPARAHTHRINPTSSTSTIPRSHSIDEKVQRRRRRGRTTAPATSTACVSRLPCFMLSFLL